MKFIFKNIKWIMLLSGILTCTMLLSLFDPSLGLLLTFGDKIDGNLANIVVRNWGALIAIIGGMLIYGAYYESSRALVLVVASGSKTIFIFLNLIFGQIYFSKSGVAIVFDSLIVIVFISYLMLNRNKGDLTTKN
ncbi:MAG: hypothetical protein MUF77_01455 [Leptospira sp.]|jgi:hypothetical protein|nr:hypothetical protein [Leptospira sp.]